MEQLAVRELTMAPAVAKPNGLNYEVDIGNGTKLELIRDVDFGVIPGTKSPSLMKSGAERILFAMGICSRYTVEQAIERVDGEAPFFYFRVKCSLFKVINGVEYHITDGMGSANSAERQCGTASGFDTANSRLKMAKKRAMVDACLLVGQLSSAFTQDIENEAFMARGSVDSLADIPKDDERITSKRAQRIYALAAANGLSTNKAKKILSAEGYNSALEVLNKDYDRICELIQKGE